METVSIVYVTWAMNESRSKAMKTSILSLIETTPEAEIIVADNGGSLEDSEFLLRLCNEGKIASYTRYRNNMHFAYARNDCLTRATGDYIAICDNDIIFCAGWLGKCVGFLKRHKGKYLTTPLEIIGTQKKYSFGKVGDWILNTRAGSNCWVMRKEDFEVLGNFSIHPIAGTYWVNNYLSKGYIMACMPRPRAKNVGRRWTRFKGYDQRKPIENFKL